MEASKLLLYIITASFICGIFSLNPNNFDNFTQKQSSKLPRFICNVIKSTKREDSGLKTVAFVTTENKLEHSMIDDVMRCMPMEISTTLIDLRGVGGKVDVKAQLVIMLADRIDGSTQGMSSLLTANHLSKFLIVTSNSAKLIPQNVQKHLNSNGIQNFAILSEENGSVAVQRPEIFNGEVKIVSKLKMFRLSRQIFPNKLKDLQGYKYKVAIDFSSYGISSRNNRIVQRTSHLFRTIAKSQNASVEFISVVNNTNVMQSSELLQFDFVLDSKVTSVHSPNTLLLYNRDSFCTLVPKFYQFSIMVDLVSRNVELSVKLMTIAAYLLIFIIWRLYEDHGAYEQASSIILKIYAAYHGQRVQFSRKNRKVLTFMIQMLMIMTVFSNLLVQWVIGISLAYPQSELGIEDSSVVFTESSDTKIWVEPKIEDFFMEVMPDYQHAKDTNRIIFYNEGSFGASNYDRKKSAFVGHCDFINILVCGDEHTYRIPDQFHKSYSTLSYKPQNPSIEKIQDMISYAFEGGLNEIWDTMTRIKLFGNNFTKSDAKVDGEIYNILDMDKLIPAFLALLKGLIGGFILLILEIFYHGFIRNLSWQLVRRWTASMASRSRQRQNENINWQNVGRIRRAWYFWRQRRNLRVQRINVRTTNV